MSSAGSVDDLSRQAGPARATLPAQLSRALPAVVDRLTPDGRMPAEAEQRGWP